MRDPPCTSDNTGGGCYGLSQHIYRNVKYETITDGIYISDSNLTLLEFQNLCKSHTQTFKRINPANLVKIADIVLEEKVCLVTTLFKRVYPQLSYNVDTAKQHLLRLPLVCIRIGEVVDGKSYLVVMEKVNGADYGKIRELYNRSWKSIGSPDLIKKEQVKDLLRLAESGRERELLRYAIYKSSGLTPSMAKRHFGFEKMNERSTKVEKCMEEAKAIHVACDEMVKVKLKALRMSGELELESSSSSGGEIKLTPEEVSEFTVAIREAQFNWFEFAERIEQDDTVFLDALFKQLCSLSPSPFSAEQLSQIKVSYEAYNADCLLYGHFRERESRILNGEIVTESESDDLSLTKEADVEGVAKRRVEAIQQQIRRKRAKLIAKQNFLGRKKCIRSNITSTYPEIGSVIEQFVQDCNIGADAWRRTGLLTFDGNKRVKQKCSYKAIKQHLESVYNRSFAYGTVVELCVARNARRLSAQRYKGVAQVISRRARKGFMLKFNPDTHWSSSFYSYLNVLQLTDGTDIVFINRDDQAGFRLDTLSTHHQFTTPIVKGREVLATYTDFVNPYPSVLQTTSYNFSATGTTDEICVGVVKAQPLHSKNPLQHSADMEMLRQEESLKNVFYNTQGVSKLIDCIRVDGATDEGPSHLEVQYWWTKKHLDERKLVTLVTTRSSGSSYLNRVELQNGCLARAHSNLFIPSTLKGSPINSETGKLDNSTLCKNLSTAIDVYIDRCDNAPCGRTSIRLFKGPECAQDDRESLLVFLKGSKKNKSLLQERDPELYSQFEKVWAVRNRHMVPNLPSQYVFCLRCCYSPDCHHVLCKKGRPLVMPCWFPGGPPVDIIPFPVPDSSRPWGMKDCSSCKGVCSGHFIKPDKTLSNVCSSTAAHLKPPSVVIKEFIAHNDSPNDQELSELAKSVLLSVEDVKLWVEHLQVVARNRKRGAAKAAATRRAKKQQVECCGVCEQPYLDETEEVEFWIQCEKCLVWFHWDCLGIQDEPSTFICSNCTRSRM